jgi:effector-binding domain-containing protein
MIPMGMRMFKIGDFAKLNRVSVSALRFYDTAGLLKPIKTDDFSGYRYYSAEQMPRLNRILTLKEMGFSLEEILLIIDSQHPKDSFSLLMEIKYKEIQGKIKEEQDRLLKLKTFMDYYKQEEAMINYDVLLKKVDTIKVAGRRDLVSDYGAQGPLWEELVTYIESNHVKMVPPCMAIYYDEPADNNLVDLQVVEPIVGTLKGNDRITVGDLAAVEEMAYVVHKGSYQSISLAYKAISKWIEDNGYHIVGPQRELYLKGEWDSESEEEYITEIQVPVSK